MLSDAEGRNGNVSKIPLPTWFTGCQGQKCWQELLKSGMRLKTFLCDTDKTYGHAWFPEAYGSGCWNIVSIINNNNLLLQGQNIPKPFFTPNFNAENIIPDFTKTPNYAGNGSIARLWFLPRIPTHRRVRLTLVLWIYKEHNQCYKRTGTDTFQSSPRIHLLPSSKHPGWLNPSYLIL